MPETEEICFTGQQVRNVIAEAQRQGVNIENPLHLITFLSMALGTAAGSMAISTNNADMDLEDILRNCISICGSVGEAVRQGEAPPLFVAEGNRTLQ